MKIKITISILLYSLATSSLADGVFTPLNTNTFKNPPAIPNPFKAFSSNEVDRIVIKSYREPIVTITVTNREVISRLCRMGLGCEFKYTWITMAGGPLAYMDFMDKSTNRIALVSVNNYHCEFTVHEAKGDLDEHGVSYNHDFVRTVYDLMKTKVTAPWMTLEFEKQLFSELKTKETEQVFERDSRAQRHSNALK